MTTAATERRLGEVVIRTYDELIAALRGRAEELDVSRQTIDAIAKFPDGYAAKLLAPVPVKTLSRMSVGAILHALGVKLSLSEDHESLDRIEKHLAKRKRRDDPNGSVLTRKKHRRRGFLLRGCSDWGKLMRARGLALQSPHQRSRHGRQMNKVRWKRQKERKHKADLKPCESAGAIP